MTFEVKFEADSSKIWGSGVPNLVKMGLYITSQSCPQSPQTDGRLRDFILCPMHMHCIGRTKKWRLAEAKTSVVIRILYVLRPSEDFAFFLLTA